MNIRRLKLNTDDLKVKIGVCANTMGKSLSDVQISVVEAIIKAYLPTGVDLSGSQGRDIISAVTGLNESTFRVMVSRLKKAKILIPLAGKGSCFLLHPLFIDLDKVDCLSIEFTALKG
jgi:hypothetical protein